MSLDINSIGGFPQATAFDGVKSRQSAAVPAPQAQPQSETVRERSVPAAGFSRMDFAAAAQAVAAAVSEGDPVKAFAQGVADDLSQTSNDMFAAVGQMNDLQNALSFALESNSDLMSDPALEAIS